ncbi:tryptophan halogenase family protein [Erythrobacter sp. F6033]|uniref:tryptophan halogenase family protein n=1 Tax=Erythrobacter sp. F6033 TaxID=2926401 RepID=UPI001FF51A13|nr:tryptophan halogenase family protein [Erythrobacter sp. F6033]MCK0127641.1 tryptophan 7-halogenase [Erythrobacter sp. F6033]
MMATQVKRVVIAGGGTAGWMTAAALAKTLSGAGISVTLVESEMIATVGVGEATIPAIAKFNQRLGIDEHEFMRATQATYKLGIEFADWGALGESYFHPFGRYGFDLEAVEFHQHWARLRGQGDPHGLSEYSLNTLAAYQGKFLRPEADHGPVIGQLGYAFHFDASLYAAFLRKFAEQRGATRIEGLIESVEQDSESGHITALMLDHDRRVEGDLFIDCTGFRGLLIDGACGAGYHDWSHWLPCNRAVAVACEKKGDPVPYTRSTAREAGWQWRIPLQHRIGNGHVFCDAYCSAEQAEEVLLANLDGKPVSSPNHLRFRTGHRDQFWSSNCVAIGLSSGFLEPLESTSIHLIQMGISKLISLFPSSVEAPVERNEYNRLMRDDFEHIRDFLVLHYKATRRDDAPFWDYVREMSIPESLSRKIELLSSQGRFFKYDAELFDVTSWLAVAEGQGWGPQGFNPLAHCLEEKNLAQSMANMRGAYAKAAAAMPAHQAYIDRFCKAAPIELKAKPI